MGNTIFIKDRMLCVKPLQNKFADIQKFKPPTTIRIKRFRGIKFLFNLYYIKGKDMILSDFLSRQKQDDSSPHEIIPVLLNM